MRSATKYAITDGEQAGWFAETATLKQAAFLVASANEYVVAIEDGKPRELTTFEVAMVELYKNIARCKALMSGRGAA
jgi:hypothetical protein